MTELVKQYAARGYDGQYVGGSIPVESPELASEIVVWNRWGNIDTDIIIVEILLDEGREIEERVHSVLKGSERPFLKGMEVRNAKRRGK